MKQDALTNPPISGYRIDSEALMQIETWIKLIHPAKCVEYAEWLIHEGSRYRTAAIRLVVHCLGEHNGSIELLSSLCAAVPVYDEPGLGVASVIRAADARLVDEIIARIAGLENAPGGPEAAQLVAQHAGNSAFDSLWSALWADRLAEKARKLAGRVFRSSAADPSRTPQTTGLVSSSLDRVFRLIPDELVYSLVMFDSIRASRDGTLSELLDRHQSRAARLLLQQSAYALQVSSLVPKATRILAEYDIEDETVGIGIALCLDLDPDYAREFLVRWVNEGVPTSRMVGFLEYKITQSDQAPLFRALADDALKNRPALRPLLALRHHGIISDVRPVLEWISKTLAENEAAQYNAALIVYYLSSPPRAAAKESLQNLRDLAQELHGNHSKEDAAEVHRRYKVADRGLEDFETLSAIALARSLLDLPPPDATVVLRNLKEYPWTYAALGGVKVDAAIAGGVPDTWSWTGLYALDLVTERRQSIERLLHGDIAIGNFQRWQYVLQSDEAARERWERRFRHIAVAGIILTPRKSQQLREDPHVWTEFRVLERLVPLFTVELEPPAISGLEGKEPDFLLHSADGDLVLEVATIGTKPEDVKEGARVETGGIAKKTLQNKWRGQFGECKGAISIPVIIALQTRWQFDVGFDLEGSLYGPERFSLTVKKDQGVVVAEGRTRDFAMGFFMTPGVECISAVAGFGPEERTDGFLAGELFRPATEPRNPLPYRLWVRLRTALYGPRPAELVRRMTSIPTIATEEAELLVDWGVDDPSLFAAGRLQYPEGMPMKKERFDELFEEARYLEAVLRTGLISAMKSARGIDLSPFHTAGIHYVLQLLEEARPTDIPQEVWEGFQAEARQLVSSSQAGKSSAG